jgi:predicted nucleotidyltransferase
MRLTTQQITHIKEKTALVFGEKAKVYLFGSRVDDNKKGGDIDLFIELDDKSDLFAKKLRFLVQLKMVLGEQKIDVVFNEDETRLIEREIRKWAVAI